MAESAVTNFAVEGQRGVVKHYERVWLSLWEVGSGSYLVVKISLGVKKKGGRSYVLQIMGGQSFKSNLGASNQVFRGLRGLKVW